MGAGDGLLLRSILAFLSAFLKFYFNREPDFEILLPTRATSDSRFVILLHVNARLLRARSLPIKRADCYIASSYWKIIARKIIAESDGTACRLLRYGFAEKESAKRRTGITARVG